MSGERVSPGSYQFTGRSTLESIGAIEDTHLQDEVWADLYLLHFEPRDDVGNPAIAEYKEPGFPGTYSIIVASGRAMVVYRVREGPVRIVQLVRLLMLE